MDNMNDFQGQPAPARKGWKNSTRLRWAAGITAAALLGAGGAVAGLALAGSSPANAAQAAALNTALSRSSAGGCATRASGAVPGGGAARRHCLPLRLREIKGMYGQVAYRTKGGTETLTFERGTVVSATGSQLTVRAADGTQWSWSLASSPVVRESGKTVPGSRLTAGARVFVGGQVVGSSRDARLIVIRTGNRSPGRGSLRGSPGSGSSSGSTSGAAA